MTFVSALQALEESMRLPAVLRRELPAPVDATPADVLIAELVARRLRVWDVRRLPIVVGVRMLVADVAAMLPLVAVRGTERIEPQPAVLRRPNPSEPYRVTIEKLVNSLTGAGNAFLRTWQAGADGWPLAVKVLDPRAIVVELAQPWNDEIAGYLYHGQHLRPSQVTHIPFISDPGPIAESPLDLIDVVVQDLATAYEWAASFWRDGGVPPYALTHPQKLDDGQADGLLDRWIVARQKHRPALLSQGWGVQTFPLPTAQDALLIDGLNYLDATIARALNVPPSILNVVSQQALTYSTTADELRRWLTLNLYPTYLARVEAGFTDLLPRGQEAVFDTSNLLRTDWPTRVTTAVAAVAGGLASVDEMRVGQLGLPPLAAQVAADALDPTSLTVEGV